MAQKYIVKPGDSLSKIAAQLGVSIGDISGYSSGSPNNIRVGESLTVNTPTPKAMPMRNDAQEAGYGNIKDGAAQPNLAEPRRKGESDAQYKARILQTPFLYKDPKNPTGFSSKPAAGARPQPTPTLSQAQAEAVLKEYGIGGTGVKVSGMTAASAKAAAEAKKKELLGAAYSMRGPSSFFDVTKLNNVKKASEQLVSGINTLKSDPWKTKEDKKLEMKEIIAKATNNYAQYFNDPQDFISSYQTDPSFSALMSDFVKAGGTVADVSERIALNRAGTVGNNQTVSDYLSGGGPKEVSIVAEKLNPDGTRSVTYSDGTKGTVKVTQNEDGSESYAEIGGPSLMDKNNAGVGDNVYTAAADLFLSPTKSAAIDEINRVAKVPKDYIDYYYGTPDKLGVFQKAKIEAEETIKNLDRAYADTKKNTAQAFDIESRKNEAAANAQVADLEEKRLQAKNYLTGRLAQLGSLTTSGAAPQALANLDAKYEQSKAQTLNTLRSTNANLTAKKKEAIAKLEGDLADKITNIKSNLNKSEGEIEKEVFKATKDAEKQIGIEIQQFNTKAQQTYKEFLNTANKASQQYIKEFLKTASGGMDVKYAKEFAAGLEALKPKPKAKPLPADKGAVVSGSLKLSGQDISQGEQKLEASRGPDGFVDPTVYKAMFDKWISGGGLSKDFVAKYPPKNYVNSENTWLPAVLRSTVKPGSKGAGSKSADVKQAP